MLKKLIKLLFILILSSSYLYGFSYTIEISQEELQEKIDKKLPLKKQKLFFATIVSDPIVTLKDELNKIQIAFNLKLVITKEIEFKTSTVLLGTLLLLLNHKRINKRDTRNRRTNKKYHNLQ